MVGRRQCGCCKPKLKNQAWEVGAPVAGGRRIRGNRKKTTLKKEKKKHPLPALCPVREREEEG